MQLQNVRNYWKAEHMQVFYLNYFKGLLKKMKKKKFTSSKKVKSRCKRLQVLNIQKICRNICPCIYPHTVHAADQPYLNASINQPKYTSMCEVFKTQADRAWDGQQQLHCFPNDSFSLIVYVLRVPIDVDSTGNFKT